MNNKIVALLPMKAHSERVNGKNFRDFNGKPLFRWILDTLLSLKEIDKVVINTDARNILLSYGLTDNNRIMIRDRHLEICGDNVSMNLIIEDDVSHVYSDIYLMTHTTNPLLSAETIKLAIRNFEYSKMTNNIDSLFTVNRIQTRFYRSSGAPLNHDPKKLVRTQDLEPWFEENSNLYLFTKHSFCTTKTRIGNRPLMFETPKLESIDIDTQEDWDFAVMTAHFLKERKTVCL